MSHSFTSLFFPLLLKILPLYGLIGLGFVAGRLLSVQSASISSILVYIISPVVIFNGVLRTTISQSMLMLPFIVFFIACTISAISFGLARRRWSDATGNIFAFSAGTGNTGYFGLPVAIALLGEEVVGTLLFFTLGLIVFENTLGFYITSRGNFSSKESLRKVLCLPTLYAFGLAVLLNIAGVTSPMWLGDLYQKFLGTYTVLGMMLLGIALGSKGGMVFDLPFTLGLFCVRFILWPLVTLGVISIDAAMFQSLSEQTVKLLLILSIVPLAANTVAYATELRAAPEKAATTVLLSTVFALFFIPLVVSLFIGQ